MSFVVFILLLSQAWAGHHSGHRLRKRFSGEATYYEVGLGACGGINVASDFVVALNAPQFDEAGTGYPSPSCGKSLTITHNGKTAQAIVVDKCPGCAHGDLDMSQGLFEFFESTGVGRFVMSWDWGGTSAPAPTTSISVAPAPTTSAAPVPSPSSTATTQSAAQTTSNANSPTTSASLSPSSTSSGSVSIASSSSNSAASSQPSNSNYGIGDDKSGLPGNVLVMQEAIVNIGSLIRHAAGQS